jgi:hypothetical protein
MSQLTDELSNLWPELMPVMGDDIVVTQGIITPYTIKGIISWPQLQENELPGYWPKVTVQLSDFKATPANGNKLTFSGRTYTVFQVIEDQIGGAMLILNG